MGAARSMAGTIDEIPLPDLLQLLSTSKKSGVLEISGDQGLGRIYLRTGQIYYATIDDSFDLGKRQLVFEVTPAGSAAGLRPADIAVQVRQGFFGEEVQRIQRGREEIRVYVRYPEATRASGIGGWPGLALIRNSMSSIPVMRVASFASALTDTSKPVATR